MGDDEVGEVCSGEFGGSGDFEVQSHLVSTRSGAIGKSGRFDNGPGQVALLNQ